MRFILHCVACFDSLFLSWHAIHWLTGVWQTDHGLDHVLRLSHLQLRLGLLDHTRLLSHTGLGLLLHLNNSNWCVHVCLSLPISEGIAPIPDIQEEPKFEGKKDEKVKDESVCALGLLLSDTAFNITTGIQSWECFTGIASSIAKAHIENTNQLVESAGNDVNVRRYEPVLARLQVSFIAYRPPEADDLS